MTSLDYYIGIAVTEKDCEKHKAIDALKSEGYRTQYLHDYSSQSVKILSDLKCRAFIPMITTAFLFDEKLMSMLNYAISHNLTVVPIILENVTLPVELELTIFSNLQSVIYWKYSDPKELIRQLQYVPQLDLCKDLLSVPRTKSRLEYGDAYYEGDVRGTIRDGYGHMFWSDGYEYTGEWKNDIMSGQGVKIWNGKTYEGQFDKGRYISDTLTEEISSSGME